MMIRKSILMVFKNFFSFSLWFSSAIGMSRTVFLHFDGSMEYTLALALRWSHDCGIAERLDEKGTLKQLFSFFWHARLE